MPRPIRAKITRVGNSSALILPKEALALLHADQGHDVYLSETPGGLKITRTNPDFERQIQLAYEAMDRFPNVFATLAK